MEFTKEMGDRAYQSVMAKTKHEKRFYELFKENTPVECARLLVEEERARCVTAIDKFLDQLNDFEEDLEEMRRTITSKPGGDL